MSNPIDTLTEAAGAEALPLELLQPIDSSNPASTPVRLSGPEQRLTLSPDPGVGDAALLPPSQVLIGKDGMTRSIWPVHLAGWQALGWQLHAEPPAPAPEPEPEPALEPEAPEPPADPAPASGEALLATETTDFQAMTKAQIIEYCSTVHGVELDGSQTKAELVEQATALELGDALL
ncbi:hypothetical protein [Synechococcus sp. RS9909]|uniref:hypothetical protein n=1 Tax=Synechococcus sp. RS9909 TaxID=221352 RepID=UPI0016494B43|nr:hypothetical protein [Synechococcus sp. RS9909]